MTEAVLYEHWRSSASTRVRIALHLAGIAYRSVPVDLLAGEHRGPEHLARNPQGLVPVLDIDGLRLTQSLAILEYLDETRGLGLLPLEPKHRARVRALAQVIAVDLHPVCNLRVARHAVEMAGGDGAMRDDWMRHFIAPGLAAFEASLAAFRQAPFCTGPAPALPDLCLVPQLYNARRYGVDLAPFPRIRAVAEACAAHPAFAASHPAPVGPSPA